MMLRLIYWSFLAVVVLIVVPIVLVRTMVEHLRGRGSLRSGSGGISAGVGAALQELDRLVARPSVEHQVEAEQRILKREDDAGGDA
jgi:branched-subunit amino acid ABC-type transport system permease component